MLIDDEAIALHQYGVDMLATRCSGACFSPFIPYDIIEDCSTSMNSFAFAWNDLKFLRKAIVILLQAKLVFSANFTHCTSFADAVVYKVVTYNTK